MVKKSLFLIALTILVSTNMLAAQFEGPAAYSNGILKTDETWPYKPIEPVIEYEVGVSDLCVMNIQIEVGWYIEILNCNQTILLKQVGCADLFNNNVSFPCYAGCKQIGVQANFDAILGLKLAKVGAYSDVITSWDAYFLPTDFDQKDDNAVQDTFEYIDDPQDNSAQWVYVCVEAWNADIWKVPADNTGQVGQLTITVRPTDGELGI